MNRAAWVAILATSCTIVLLAALHILSPEFSPAWRVVSEYALGRYGWVLSLFFLSWGIGAWALAVALRPQVQSKAGKMGVWFLTIAALGEAMASVFDVTQPALHGIAGFLGVIGFPIGAVLLSVALRRKALLWIANLNWISVLLLIASLVTMTMQMMRINGGQLPQHAPKSLPPGVLALDGYADRLIVLTNCAWVLLAAWTVRRASPRDSAPPQRG